MGLLLKKLLAWEKKREYGMETELQNSLCRLQEADATVQGAKTTIMQQEQIDATLASSLRPASPAQAHPRPPPPVLPSAKVATTAQGCDWIVLVFFPQLERNE